MNILIVKLSALGDVVQAIPTFEALRRHYPAAHIAWLVEEETAELLAHYPGLNDMLVCRRRMWLKQMREPSLWPMMYKDIVQFCRRLRQRHYDLILDLQGLLKSGVWVAMARGTRKIGYDRTREASWRFLNERLPAYDADRHALERYLDVARYLGAEVGDVPVRDFWTAAEKDHFQERLSQTTGDAGGPLVACHPISRWQTKLWPELCFARLAAAMVAGTKATVVFTGSAEDRNEIERITQAVGVHRVFNWAGKTGLRELAYLYKNASVVVSTDSGPMHLAAAVGTPVVALFGPTTPRRTGPFGNGHKVLRAGLDCSPCFQRTCKTAECMALISVEEVLQAVTELLNKE